MNKKIDCGFGVTITPIIRIERGLNYSDYKIENSEDQNDNQLLKNSLWRIRTRTKGSKRK